MKGKKEPTKLPVETSEEISGIQKSVDDNSSLSLIDLKKSTNNAMLGASKIAVDIQNLLNSDKGFENFQHIIPKPIIYELNNFKDFDYFKTSNFINQISLNQQIHDLRSQLAESVKLLDNQKEDEENLIRLEAQIKQLSKKQSLNHILSRVCENGQNKLFSSTAFQVCFDNGSMVDATVLSIDIRRSTELMLKARNPKLYSTFITELAIKLSKIIRMNFGIYDKFTGDGILAFFPKFYSGKESVIRTLKAANECHLCFHEHFHQNKNAFNIFLNDIGLGIGIDFGEVCIVNNAQELSVVGIPVVYACRFSNANAGDTLLNLGAREELHLLCSEKVHEEQTEIFIKYEGNALAYKISLHESAYYLSDPTWDEFD
jgi:adenylate cyclase